MEPQYYKIKNFKFESGLMLPEIKIEYKSFGEKKYDDNGNLSNAIIYLHGWSGDYNSVKRIKNILGPGRPIDTDKYYIISPSALGSPRSSAPSTSGLGNNFPKYTIKDMVNAIHIFCRECFNINHLKGVIGNSMGGFQALEWAVSYPDYMDFVIPLTTSHEIKGKNFAVFNIMNEFIKNDPEYNEGKYENNPISGLQNASMLLYLLGFSNEYYKKCDYKNMLDSINEMKKEGALMDANDVVWRNEAASSHDVTSRISNIKSRILIIGINQDQYFPPEVDTIPMSKLINESKIVLYDSILGHLGSSEIEKVKKAISDFLYQKPKNIRIKIE